MDYGGSSVCTSAPGLTRAGVLARLSFPSAGWTLGAVTSLGQADDNKAHTRDAGDRVPESPREEGLLIKPVNRPGLSGEREIEFCRVWAFTHLHPFAVVVGLSWLIQAPADRMR